MHLGNVMDTNNVMISHNESTTDFGADRCKQLNYVIAEKKINKYMLR